MKRYVLLILIAIAASLHEVLAGSGYRSLTMDDGLPSNAVRNIVQDADGFIWFGTDNGLCQYDGTRIRLVRMAEMGLNQYVSALLEHGQDLFVGTDRGVFRLHRPTGEIVRLPIDISHTVKGLAVDKDENLWVATLGQGVWRFGLHTARQHQYDFKDLGGEVSQVFIDHSHQVWAVSKRRGPSIQRLNRLRDCFEPVTLSFPSGYHSLCMLQTRDGRMWLGSWDSGLLLMHSDGQLEQVLNPALAKVGTHIHTLFEKADDCIFVGCDEGVVCFNPLTRQWRRLHEGRGLADRFAYSVISDTEGGIWVGTFYGGVNYVSPMGRRFEGYMPEGRADGLTGSVISRFCEGKDGVVWMASDDGGLIAFMPETHRFVDYPHRDELSQQNVHALCMDGDDLWIGTYTNGVFVLNTTTGRMVHYQSTASDPRSLDDGSCYAISKDRQSRIWVATMKGLNRYDRSNDSFEHVKNIGALTIDIDEDRKGRLWLSTQGKGIWRHDPADGSWQQYGLQASVDGQRADDQVNCMLVDDDGRLWAGASTGLWHYDEGQDHFALVALGTHEPNVTSIVETGGALWLSTEAGVLKYVPEEGVQQFTRHDGLVSEQFMPNSGVKTSDGRVFFGSTNGFNTFLPYQIRTNGVLPPVRITSHREQQLDVSYGERAVELTFASLSYCSPEKNQYAYKLDGFDQDWNYVGNQSRATYMNIPAGTYTFRVKATNNDGVWSSEEATLTIVVHPPFWWSWYAKLFYLLLVVGFIWWYIHYRLKRAEREHQQELLRLNEQKEKEVREARLNFFTMIAHEIRTPVSLIVGPLEKLMKQGTPSDDMKIIDRNAQRLLELVNHLLDFRKMEQQSLVMHFAEQDICELVASVGERFAPTFRQAGKQFVVNCPDHHFKAMVDREGIVKVVSNLLTNANKYTKDHVELTCRLTDDGSRFSVEVADNGVGIREEDRQRIFDPFFQAMDNKPGTGIGLNIVKNIVDRHHGTISVVSEVGQGSTFTVVLPVAQEEISESPQAPQDTPQSPLPTPHSPLPTPHSPQDTPHSPQDTPHSSLLTPHSSLLTPHSTPKMLIVDDNEDMVSFLKSHFETKYQVLTAADGIEALQVLQQHEVQLIVSDWMMPRMDGAELCRRVRSDAVTSHIHFIMLTAKTDNDSKIEGMDVGADAYVEKPFSVEYLERCIRNMLDMRSRLRDRFSNEPMEPVEHIASNPTDSDFLARMAKVIEDNITNPDLSVAFLAEQLCISRSGLFAKIKSLAGMPPNEMIQVMRLKRAAQLLQQQKYLVSEVGYMVGFSNPSYFSKCFQKQFGMKPAEFQKRTF